MGVFQQVNWIDLLVVILLIRSSYVGFTRGFGWELFRFVGYACTVLATIYYYETVSQAIGDYLPVISPFANLISFASLFLIILFIFKFINVIIGRIIKIETLSVIEKFGGLLLGFFRGSIFTSLVLITLIFTHIPYFEKSIKERSYSGQLILKVVPFLYGKTAILIPPLKLGQKNEALSKLTNLQEGLFVFRSVKPSTSGKKGALKGDTREY
jgi:uncharacterized membrane protein required for colicin V production